MALFAKKEQNVEIRVVHAEPTIIKETVTKELIVQKSQSEDLRKIDNLKGNVNELSK